MEGVFLGWHLSPGGKWHGDYIVAALQDFLNKKKRVRVYQVKEVVQPDAITFPLKASQAQLEAASPEEDEIEFGDGEEAGSKVRGGTSRPYKGSSKPEYIDSKSWKRLQYHDRKAIAEFEEKRQQARLAEGELPSEGVDDHNTSGAAAVSTDTEREQQVASATPAPQPVIIEYCCDPDSQLGKVAGYSKVFRVTKDSGDVTTEEGAEATLKIARDNPGALLFTSLRRSQAGI